MKKRMTLTIYGDVQGVFFRSYLKERADSLGLSGYAKNNPNGTVSVVVEGDGLDTFLSRARDGNGKAKIKEISTSFSDVTDEYSGFEIR